MATTASNGAFGMLTAVDVAIEGSLTDGSDAEEPPKVNPSRSPEDVEVWTRDPAMTLYNRWIDVVEDSVLLTLSMHMEVQSCQAQTEW